MRSGVEDGLIGNRRGVDEASVEGVEIVDGSKEGKGTHGDLAGSAAAFRLQLGGDQLMVVGIKLPAVQ